MDGSEFSTWPVYECLSCRNRVSYAKLMEYVSFRCPKCGYTILRKIRTPGVKRLKAR